MVLSHAYSSSKGYYPLEAWNIHPGYVEAMHATLTHPYFAHWGLILHDPDNDVDVIPSLPSRSVNSKFYDISGRRLTLQPTRRGVYIIDGKKVVVR